ncbi:dipeptidase [Gephyromycinifex aptenodytis]|uniref:dipeptidase n=1 Tax=Gephyromycinifex aptenodytis TaxID=2716227 RepID=UPI0014483B50|nr:dipeptidase [Gephyromycinifex aptenodytis]
MTAPQIPLLFDAHNDLPWAARELTGGDWNALNLQHGSPTQTDLPRLAAGGVGAQFWSVFVPGTLPEPQAVAVTLQQIDAVHRLLAAHPETFALARTADDIAQARASARIASLLGAEGGHSIGSSLAVLRMLHLLGVGYLTLTHNEHLPWADCAVRPPRLHGLSPFGRAVVVEMNRLGMLVDLSHTSPDTMRAALETSAAPIVFTHSGARALCDHPRNVPDDILQQMAASGGVCCATFVPAFCSPARYAWEAQVDEQAAEAGIDTENHAVLLDFALRRVGPPPPVGVAEVADHVEHLREVAGVEHVGIGADFDGTAMLPEGLQDVSGYPRLFAALEERGWSRQERALLAGGNLLRVLEDAHSHARGRTDEPNLATIETLDQAVEPDPA